MKNNNHQPPRKKGCSTALLEIFIAVPFMWLIWIPKVIFWLPEASISERLIRSLWIFFWCVISFILINSIPAITEQPQLQWLTLPLGLYFGLSLLGIFHQRFFNNNSIDPVYSRACSQSLFLVRDEHDLSLKHIPPIIKKLPGRIIIKASGWTFTQVDAVMETFEASLHMPVGGIEHFIVEGEVKPGYYILWYNRRNLPSLIPFRKVYKNLPAPGYCKLGYSMKGWIELGLNQLSHFLVFSTTGYGKSNMLVNMLVQYYLTIPTAVFLLIDFKGGETFFQFRNIKNCVTVTNTGIKNKMVAYQRAVSALKMVIDIMENRHAKIAEDGKKTYYSYGMFPIFVFVEEMREFLKGYKQFVTIGKKKIPSYQMTCASILETLTAEGRSTGIHVFIGTQRYDAEAGPVQIRENLPIKIGGKTGSKEGSKMIVNTEYLHRMEAIPGRMAFVNLDGSGGFIKMQVPFIDEGEALDYLQEHEHREINGNTERLLWALKNPKWWLGRVKSEEKQKDKLPEAG